MIKKHILLTLLAAAMAVSVSADDPAENRGKGERSAEKPGPRREGGRGRISPPVYATSQTPICHPDVMTPEARNKINNARRRRFEIMILINAYKLLPEQDRAPVKAELLKRVDADFQAMVVDQKERIANAEAELKRLRQELEEREKNREDLVKRELERLLKMPVPGADGGRRPRK